MSSEGSIDFVDAVRVGRRSYALWREFSAPLLVVEDLRTGRCRRVSLPFPFRVERYTAATMGDRYIALEIGAHQVVGFFVLDMRSMAPALVVQRGGGHLLPGSNDSLWQYCGGAGLYRVQVARSRLRRYLFAEERRICGPRGRTSVRRGCASKSGATLLLADGGIVEIGVSDAKPRVVGELGVHLPDVRCMGRVGDLVVYVTVDALATLKGWDLKSGEERRVDVPFEVGMLRPLGVGSRVAVWSLGASQAEVWDMEEGSWVGNGVGVPVHV